jgi:hypothetical protein
MGKKSLRTTINDIKTLYKGQQTTTASSGKP